MPFAIAAQTTMATWKQRQVVGDFYSVVRKIEPVRALEHAHASRYRQSTSLLNKWS